MNLLTGKLNDFINIVGSVVDEDFNLSQNLQYLEFDMKYIVRGSRNQNLCYNSP